MLTAFAMGKFELTRGQFAVFVAQTNWKTDGPCAVLEDGPTNRWSARDDRNWRDPGFAQKDNHPVVCVNIRDAQAYIVWLNGKTSGRTLRYRLPTGEEWEYAARAGASTTRHWGDGTARACEFANGSDQSRARAHNAGVADPARFLSCDDGYVYTAPVGSFKPNAFGLFDTFGNVLEWTSDCVVTDGTNAKISQHAPLGDDCSSQLNRGGAWNNSPKYLRAASKHDDLVDARNAVLGIRLARDSFTMQS